MLALVLGAQPFQLIGLLFEDRFAGHALRVQRAQRRDVLVEPITLMSEFVDANP